MRDGYQSATEAVKHDIVDDGPKWLGACPVRSADAEEPFGPCDCVTRTCEICGEPGPWCHIKSHYINGDIGRRVMHPACWDAVLAALDKG